MLHSKGAACDLTCPWCTPRAHRKKKATLHGQKAYLYGPEGSEGWWCSLEGHCVCVPAIEGASFTVNKLQDVSSILDQVCQPEALEECGVQLDVGSRDGVPAAAAAVGTIFVSLVRKPGLLPVAHLGLGFRVGSKLPTPKWPRCTALSPWQMHLCRLMPQSVAEVALDLDTPSPKPGNRMTTCKCKGMLRQTASLCMVSMEQSTHRCRCTQRQCMAPTVMKPGVSSRVRNHTPQPWASPSGVPVAVLLGPNHVEGLRQALCCNRDGCNQRQLLVLTELACVKPVAGEVQLLQQGRLLSSQPWPGVAGKHLRTKCRKEQLHVVKEQTDWAKGVWLAPTMLIVSAA